MSVISWIFFPLFLSSAQFPLHHNHDNILRKYSTNLHPLFFLFQYGLVILSLVEECVIHNIRDISLFYFTQVPNTTTLNWYKRVLAIWPDYLVFNFLLLFMIHTWDNIHSKFLFQATVDIWVAPILSICWSCGCINIAIIRISNFTHWFLNNRVETWETVIKKRTNDWTSKFYVCILYVCS